MELKGKLEIISERLSKLNAPIEVAAASMINYHVIEKALKILNENSKIIDLYFILYTLQFSYGIEKMYML